MNTCITRVTGVVQVGEALFRPDVLEPPTGLEAARARGFLFTVFAAVSWPVCAFWFLRLILRPEMRNNNHDDRVRLLETATLDLHWGLRVTRARNDRPTGLQAATGRNGHRSAPLFSGASPCVQRTCETRLRHSPRQSLSLQISWTTCRSHCHWVG